MNSIQASKLQLSHGLSAISLTGVQVEPKSDALEDDIEFLGGSPGSYDFTLDRTSGTSSSTGGSSNSDTVVSAGSGLDQNLSCGPKHMRGRADATGGREPNQDSQSPDNSSARPTSSVSRQNPRRPPGRRPFQTPPPPPTQDEFQNNAAGSSSQQQQLIQPPFRGSHVSPYTPAASAPYNQGGNFVGQYTMSSQAPYAYQHSQSFRHPGMHALDTSMHPGQFPPHMGFPSPGLQPPHHAHTTVYPYQRPSPESSPSHSFTRHSSSPGPQGVYQHGQSAPDLSPPQHTPLTSQAPTGQALHSQHYTDASLATQFASLNYPAATSQFQYHTPSPPALYHQSQYPPTHYQQTPYMTPSEEGGQGSWWYLPHASQGPSPGQYHIPYTMPYQQHNPYSQHAHPQSPQHPSMPSGSSQTAVRDRGGDTGVDPLSSPVSGSRAGNESPDDHRSSDRHAVRRAYHPNPPPHRSEWVMWVGNVPADATHDELWRFFNQPPPAPQQQQHPSTSASSSSSTSAAHLPADLLTTPEDDIWGGVSSVFLISRSNCAFVNFDTEAHLERAVARFNAQQIRPSDPRCPRLVCRVRRRDDDLRAGVGGQRGLGMHTRWVKDQKDRTVPPAPSPSDEHAHESSPSAPSTSSEVSNPPAGHAPAARYSGSSGSYASTNSSFLMRHFPKRYFILKSLSPADLNLSVEQGVWATQSHNEGILDQAYRTSTEVYLIFSANKSGEFFGYARMAGPIIQGGHRISWASRTDSSPHSPTVPVSPTLGRGSHPPETILEDTELGSDSRHSHQPFFSPSDQTGPGESPAPMTPHEAARLGQPSGVSKRSAERQNAQSAPTELHQPHKKLTLSEQHTPGTLDSKTRQHTLNLVMKKNLSAASDFQLDATRLEEREQQAREALERVGKQNSAFVSPEERRQWPVRPGLSEEAGPSGEREDLARGGEDAPTWGTPFKVEWIRTDRLPFQRTRHLRNPWNHDREVKVSRDGTELEPTVGQKLLEEWDRPEPPQPPQPPQTPAGSPTARRSAPGSRPGTRGGQGQFGTRQRGDEGGGGGGGGGGGAGMGEHLHS